MPKVSSYIQHRKSDEKLLLYPEYYNILVQRHGKHAYRKQIQTKYFAKLSFNYNVKQQFKAQQNQMNILKHFSRYKRITKLEIQFDDKLISSQVIKYFKLYLRSAKIVKLFVKTETQQYINQLINSLKLSTKLEYLTIKHLYSIHNYHTSTISLNKVSNKLINLKYLDFEGNGDDYESLANNFLSFTNLNSFSQSSQSENIQQFIKANQLVIQKFQSQVESLEYVFNKACQVSDKAIDQITNTLGQWKELQNFSIILSRVGALEASLNLLFDSIKRNGNNLKSLNLELSNIIDCNDYVLKQIANSFPGLLSIQHLSIKLQSNQSITNRGMLAIGKGLKPIAANLTNFNFSINNCHNVTPLGVQEMYYSIGSMKSLESLSLTCHILTQDEFDYQEQVLYVLMEGLIGIKEGLKVLQIERLLTSMTLFKVFAKNLLQLNNLHSLKIREIEYLGILEILNVYEQISSLKDVTYVLDGKNLMWQSLYDGDLELEYPLLFKRGLLLLKEKKDEDYEFHDDYYEDDDDEDDIELFVRFLYLKRPLFKIEMRDSQKCEFNKTYKYGKIIKV